MSLLDQLVMTMPLTRPTQEARAMVPDAPPEGGRTTTTMTRLLPLLYLPLELHEGFRQAMECEERLSEAVKRAASARDLVCQRISLMKTTGTCTYRQARRARAERWGNVAEQPEGCPPASSGVPPQSGGRSNGGRSE